MRIELQGKSTLTGLEEEVSGTYLSSETFREDLPEKAQ